MEEIKPQLKEELYFENRSNSKLKTFSAFSDIKIMMQESNKNLLIEFSFITVELSIDMLMVESKMAATEKIKFKN